jgi:hypothetical protein
VLRVDRIDDDLVAAILQNPKSATRNHAERQRPDQSRPMQWRNLIAVCREGLRRHSRQQTRTGRRRVAAGDGEILIERDAFQVAKAKIGDTVT